MIEQDPEEEPMDTAEHLDDVLIPEPPIERAEDEGLPPVESEPEPEVAAPVSTMLWYIIHTYSGFEAKVAESLKTRAQAFGFDTQIGDILMPKETVVELRNGKKVTSERLLYPGYLMVQMEMDDRLWHEV